MPLDRVDEALLVAAWFRDGRRVSDDDEYWIANVNQVLTLSLFYTGDITAAECARRFAKRNSVGGVYDSQGLTKEIVDRDQRLRELVQRHPDLIEGGGHEFSEPTYRGCGLTTAGLQLAQSLIDRFPAKPDFPHSPDHHPPASHS